jgi:HlyD family secretion protein
MTANALSTDVALTPRLDPAASIRRLSLIGYGAVAVFVFGVGGWSVQTQIAGAVISPGRVVVESSVKKVQHPTGGVVGQLFVREGQHVKADELLIRLDQTQTLASLDIIREGLDEMMARKARDEAERDGLNAVVYPKELTERIQDPRIERLLAEEEQLFEARRAEREGEKAQYNEQIEQLVQESQGTLAEIEAKTKEIYWNGEEATRVRDLWSRKLVEFTRMTSLSRDAARLEGERGRLQADLAGIRNKTAEIKLKILQVDAEARGDAGKELAEIRAKMGEQREKAIASEDQLRRTDIRAPQTGFVHQLIVHTVGGVITAGEPIMLIVPDEDSLAIESRVDPNDINQVHFGQKAVVRFPGLGQRTTPEIDGLVSLVSADLSQDDRNTAVYYMIRVSLTDEQVRRLGNVKLVPGMPAEIFVETPSRTVLYFLLKPINDQMERVFRER